MPRETTFCRICECLCGLEAEREGDRIVKLHPDPAHVATAGFACVKGLKQHALYDSPDRLLYPERRRAEAWERLSWPTALSQIGGQLARLRAQHGPESIGMYVGTAAGFSVLHPVFAQGLMTGIGSGAMYSSASQDCSNKFAVATLLYGFPFTQPFPDLDHVQCLIVVGANPVISKWSFLQVPHPARALKELTARGAKLYFVDPRRHESARTAGEHVPIRPDTDVFFYLSFLRELLQRGPIDRARIARYMVGFEELEALVEPWTAERTSQVTGISAARLRQLVDAYRQADGAVLYSSTGVNMGSNGSLAFWLQEVCNAISGNLDRRGGTLVGRGLFDFAAFSKKHGLLLRRDRSRVGAFRAVNDAFPGGTLADEILTAGKGQLRALIVTGGNPLLTMPNSARLRRALESLELLVCIDIFRGETASLAHYTLPATSPLQRPDLPFLFPLLLGMQRRPYLQATAALLPPRGEQRDEASIYLDLARAAGTPIFGSRIAQRLLEATRLTRRLRGGDRGAGRGISGGGVDQELLLSLLSRLGGEGSFRGLLQARHGRLRRPHRPGDFLGLRVVTDDGKVQLAPRELLDQAAARLEPAFQRELAAASALKLITRRAVTTHNSWMHNHPDFVAGRLQRNYLYMHPDDALRRGLDDGELVDVRTPTAVVRLPLSLCADLALGVVALPHGWGHQQASGLSVAHRTAGVNVNLLAADGPQALEPLSGMAQLTGFAVEVSAASGPAAEDSWSGLPGNG